MILADATPDATFTLQTLLTLNLLGGLIFLGLQIWSSLANRKAKREVSFEKEPASKVELEKHIAENRREHEGIFSKIGGVERGANGALENKLEALRKERSVDVGRLHTEVNEVGRKVAGLEKSTELQNQTLAHMNAKLDRLAERHA